MAEQIGVKAATFSGYERGYRVPETKTVEKLANLYGVSMDYLLGREEAWLYKDSPPDDIDLERFIRECTNLRLFCDPLNGDVKDDIMLALRTVWEISKKKRPGFNRPKS